MVVLMARHWYPLAESGDAFLKSAPFRYVHSVETTAPAERIWEVLTGEKLVHWVWVFTGLRWVSPRPFGVGTVRDVTLLGVFTARERFFRWDEGHRFTFNVFEASLPGFRHAAEDWTIESTPSGSRLTWTMAIEAIPLVTPLMWVSSPVIRLVKRRALRTIRAHVDS
ncbi:SRPBCC family protein [Streptomyces phaeochromogenes]|uniref:SRPBCC family protein n=1 Tax=Streptomyces phaeochromogenes TaxID=1923 RepID=UPI0033FF4ADC|nr:SRPBCC family protein [Streptomyces phaeochromogenes]